jgi:phage terminase large subunit-like protein
MPTANAFRSKDGSGPASAARVEWVPIGALRPNPKNARTHSKKLRGEVDGIVGMKPEGDKASRMAVASAKFEAGQVLLPERAPWLADLEAELFVFPGGRHDDQCDSISQALLDKNNSFMMWMTSEDWDRLYAGLSTLRPRNPIGWGRW